MENKISVIMTTYNQEHTIARALDSILMQQCRLPIEIIVGEDCSTDNTLAICREYASRHPQEIVLIANERNKGVVDNYFDCLLQASGKYIADCAGDDFWTDPLKLEKELCILEQHDDVTMVHTDWLYYDEATGNTSKHSERCFTSAFVDGRSMLEAILTQTTLPVVHLCTALYRKEAFQKAYEEDTYLFRNKEFGCEDLSLTFMLARQGQIAYLPDVTLSYSVNHESVSSHKDEARQFRFVCQTTQLVHYLSYRYGPDNKHVERHLQERLFAMAMHAFRAYSPQLRSELLCLQQKLGIAADKKTLFVLAVTSGKATWRTALFLRRLLIGLKH